jgi:hypothetical protein
MDSWYPLWQPPFLHVSERLDDRLAPRSCPLSDYAGVARWEAAFKYLSVRREGNRYACFPDMEVRELVPLFLIHVDPPPGDLAYRRHPAHSFAACVRRPTLPAYTYWSEHSTGPA